jgi:glutaredoxin 3
MATRVKLYTKSACPFCVNAKALFERLGVPFEEISVDGNPALRDEIRERYDWPTVPVVVVDGECVGGFTDVAKLAESGELARRLGLG